MGELPTDTIQRLLRVIPGLMLEPGDARPLLPPVINLSVTVPFEYFPGFPGTANRTVSTTYNADQGPSQAQLSIDTNTFGAGLWRINWKVQEVADFAVTTNASLQLIRAVDLFVNTVHTMRLHSANVTYAAELDYEILLREAYFLRVTVPATGVAQNIFLRGGALITRLL